MALAITATPLVPSGGRFKGRKVVNVKFIGDASNAAAGYTVAAASVGLRIVESGVMGCDRNGIMRFSIIPSATDSSALTSSSNQFTLAIFLSNNATPGASNASVGSATVDGIIFGY
jgi:prephenate dehydratase